MSDPKAQAKLEIQEIIEKIKKGESPNTSRAYELMERFGLGSFETSIAEAIQKASIDKQKEQNSTSPEISTDPVKVSENFFKDPEVKEILETHKAIAKDGFDAKKHKTKLIKTSNKAETFDKFNKQQIESLEKKRESIRINTINGNISVKDGAMEVVKLTDNITKHKQILGQSAITQAERKKNNLKNNQELFADNNRASRIARDIDANNNSIANKEIDNAKSMLEQMRPKEKTQEHSAPTIQNHYPPRNLDTFKENTPVEYVNLGASRSPSSTPKVGGRGPTKSASK